MGAGQPAEGNGALMDYNDFLEARREFYRLRGWHEELGYGEFREDAERALGVVKKRVEFRVR